MVNACAWYLKVTVSYTYIYKWLFRIILKKKACDDPEKPIWNIRVYMRIKIEEIKSAYHNKRLLVHTWFDCVESIHLYTVWRRHFNTSFWILLLDIITLYRSDRRITRKLFFHLIIITGQHSSPRTWIISQKIDTGLCTDSIHDTADV